jgi:predicted RNase H-like nuclease (RuvC/YqgF family)
MAEPTLHSRIAELDEPTLRQRLNELRGETNLVRLRLHEIRHAKRQQVDMTPDLERRRRAEQRRRDKITAIPALEKEIAALRQHLQSQSMFVEALPGPMAPVRKEPPAELEGAERVKFTQNALGQYKTALANWLPDERDRLKKLVEYLPVFE